MLIFARARVLAPMGAPVMLMGRACGRDLIARGSVAVIREVGASMRVRVMCRRQETAPHRRPSLSCMCCRIPCRCGGQERVLRYACACPYAARATARYVRAEELRMNCTDMNRRVSLVSSVDCRHKSAL
eukprot:6931528-Prymnesium_polylepis.1